MIVEFWKEIPPEIYNLEPIYYYSLKALNGQVMLESRSYSTYRKCVEGWRTVQKNLGINDIRIKYRWQKGF